jgi:hypothetical protein
MCAIVNEKCQSNVGRSRQRLVHAGVEIEVQHVFANRKWSIYILQQITFPLPSFRVRNISFCENELSDLTNTIVNISGLKVKEWKHVYAFSFTFSHIFPIFIVFYLFLVFLSMLLFYLSAINLILLAQCRIGWGRRQILLHLTSLVWVPWDRCLYSS